MRFRLFGRLVPRCWPIRGYRWYAPETPRYSHWQYAAFVLGGSATAYLVAMMVDAERQKGRRRSWMEAQRLERLSFSRTNSGAVMQEPGIYAHLVRWWRTSRESERTILMLIAANTAVFLAWRLPSAQPFLTRYFLHSTRSHPLTLVTSIFSHMTGTHLLFNMIALYSFGRYVHERMGREQFLAFYLTSGMASSLGSHLVKSYRADLARSLGASGAVFALAAGCAHNPDLRISLIFLPFLSAPIKWALPAMMAYDTIGLLKRWSTFDHAAHLAGALFGYIFYAASMQHIWPRRQRILQALHYPLKP